MGIDAEGESVSTQPVDDWSTDYDIFDPDYIADPVPIWRELREGCPVAHSERYGPAWLPTRYADVAEMARLVPELSSDEPTVVPLRGRLSSDDPSYGVGAPPISVDPPEHSWSRRLILPYFSPRAVERHRQFTVDLCDELIDSFDDRTTIARRSTARSSTPSRSRRG